MGLNTTQDGLKIKVSDADIGVWATAERIREARGSMVAELRIEAERIDGTSRKKSEMSHSRIDLLDDGSKSRLILKLEDKTIDDPSYPTIAWGQLVESVCSAIVEHYRKGSPPKKMDNLLDYNKRSYLINDMIVKGAANLIWAEGGSAKSYFALLTCVLVDKGYGDKSLGLYATKGNAMYIDFEETEDMFKQRLYAVQKGLRIPDPAHASGIWYQQLADGLAGHVEELSEFIEQNNINYVVIDSVGRALIGDGAEQQPVEELFAALQHLKVTTLLVDHATKSGDLYGSVYKHARARQIYQIKKAQHEDADGMNIMIENIKSNDFKIKSPKTFMINFDNHHAYENNVHTEWADSVTFKIISNSQADPELQKRLSISEVTKGFLKDKEWVDIVAIAEHYNSVTESNISWQDLESVIEFSPLFERVDNNIRLTVNGTEKEVETWEI